MTAAPGGAVLVGADRALLRRERRSSWAVAVLSPLVLFVVLGAAWQGVAASSPSLLPPLQGVVADLAARPAFYLAETWATLQEALLGLLLGVAVALLLATLMVHVRALEAAVLPFALVLVSTPVVAIAPALIAAFGFTLLPHVLTVALIVFFPMLLNSLRGLRQVDSDALEVLRALAATRLDVLLRLRLPSSLPFLFTGLRLAASAAVTGAVVSEFVYPQDGLGSAMILALTQGLDLAQLWGCIAVAAVVTMALLGLAALLERAVVRW